MKTVVKVITQANIKWYYCSFGASEFSHPLAINQNHFHIFRYFVTATLHLWYPKSVFPRATIRNYYKDRLSIKSLFPSNVMLTSTQHLFLGK